MFPSHCTVADLLVLPGTACAGRMAPLTRTRLSARLNRVQEHATCYHHTTGKSADQARFSALGAATAAAIRTNMMDSATGATALNHRILHSTYSYVYYSIV